MGILEMAQAALDEATCKKREEERKANDARIRAETWVAATWLIESIVDKIKAAEKAAQPSAPAGAEGGE